MRTLLILFLGLYLSGCATMINGSKQPVSFMSEPSGATISVGGEFTTQTPAALPLTRGKDYSIIVKKEGYESQSLVIRSSFTHWVQATLGNWWTYIIPGLVVDAISGGAYEFDQPLVNVILVKTKEASSSSPASPLNH